LTTHSRLFPLHNGGLGDCLLHSTLQAAAGVEDPVTSLRSSLCATMKSIDLYPRWREARAREAFNDGFRADEWQWRKEWTDLVHVASLPKTSLEQTHVWALAHVLRRPIIVYAILNIRNFRDEVVDLARHQGIYLPMLLDRRDCSSNPIALAYVRGHYLGLVGEEKEASTSTTVLLPVTTPDSQLLPVHFLSDMERGSEAAIIREWFCCRHVDGVMCVEQQTPARADRPQACQALISRYVQDLQARFCSKAAHRGGGADGAGSEGGIAGQGGTGTGVRAENDWVRFDDGDEASR
jgi:ubiquitin thioesterase ZRANB1